jgi:hypothetical protein
LLGFEAFDSSSGFVCQDVKIPIGENGRGPNGKNTDWGRKITDIKY